MTYKSIHRTVLARLALVWLVLSLVLGAIVFRLEMNRADALMLDLAAAESRSFTDHVRRIDPRDPSHLEALRQRAAEFLKSDFISVRIYDATQRMILEAVEADVGELPRELQPHVHPLAPGDHSHYHTHWVSRQPFMQVLLPIDKDGALLGYFEGVHRLDAQTAKDVVAGIVRSLASVVIVILATAVALYPVIIYLNRDLVARSHALLQSNLELMEVLGSAVAKRDSDTDRHNYRVTIYAVRLAQALGLSRRNIQRLIAGAFLHDVGKIGVADAVLRKAGPLDAEERSQIRAHVPLGVEIIANARWLESARDVVESHHERFDGTGYPRALRGETIPLNARIFAIADVFDALMSGRAYKEPMGFDGAILVMRCSAGSHFDPRLFAVFETIAPRLHTELGGADEAGLRATLHQLVGTYFDSNAGAEPLRGRRAQRGQPVATTE